MSREALAAFIGAVVLDFYEDAPPGARLEIGRAAGGTIFAADIVRRTKDDPQPRRYCYAQRVLDLEADELAVSPRLGRALAWDLARVR